MKRVVHLRMARSGSTHEVDLKAIGIVYQGLNCRISDNFDLQWRGPVFALTAQAFLFVVFVDATTPKLWVLQFLVGMLILIVGGVSSLVMDRAGVRIAADQKILDKYEKKLLGDSSEFLLHHESLKERFEFAYGPGGSKTVWWLSRRQRNSERLWQSLQLSIGVLGLGAGIWAFVVRR